MKKLANLCEYKFCVLSRAEQRWLAWRSTQAVIDDTKNIRHGKKAYYWGKGGRGIKYVL